MLPQTRECHKYKELINRHTIWSCLIINRELIQCVLWKIQNVIQWVNHTIYHSWRRSWMERIRCKRVHQIECTFALATLINHQMVHHFEERLIPVDYNRTKAYTMAMRMAALLSPSPPGAAYMCQWPGSTLVQVMACCLIAPSQYLRQCWFIINYVLWHSSEGII